LGSQKKEIKMKFDLTAPAWMFIAWILSFAYLLVTKLAGVHAFTWFVVLSPLWGFGGLFMAVVILLFMIILYKLGNR